MTDTDIVTRHHQLVLPDTNSCVDDPEATTIAFQDRCSQDCSEHPALATSRVAASYVLNAHDPTPLVSCMFVPPFVDGR
ncbi:hypothetical protein [Rhodococcus sp. OK519]|uniref:hypothetical protein n=1 Tax=Rhodococcus sp. OK519 TaxID=2135729 RepID=UPI000D3AEA33